MPEITETKPSDMADLTSIERRENQLMRASLTRIANFTDPDEIDGDDWGVTTQDAVEMAYDNVLEEARYTLSQLSK